MGFGRGRWHFASFNLAIEILIFSACRTQRELQIALDVSISQSRYLYFQLGGTGRIVTELFKVSISQSRYLYFQQLKEAQRRLLHTYFGFNLAIEILIFSALQ